MSNDKVAPCHVYLVCGGLYHDFDYVRLELLRHLSKYPHIRCVVASDYSDVDQIMASDGLVTYTTDVVPSTSAVKKLKQFLEDGKKWFALHGTNSIIDIDDKGYASSPRTAPEFMTLLGSQFVAHPEKGPFQVHVTQPDHPLVEGIQSFEVEDELYLVETHGDMEVLLHSHFNGKAMKGFKEREFFSDEKRPIMYLKSEGRGQVLYLNLGHCRGHHDMRPLLNWYPEVERCSWDSPVFRELIDRGVGWLQER
ncbi:MAG: ThuA domain-containing protein [Pseudomonadota bacterium]